MELTFKDKSYAFTINPENYDIKLQKTRRGNSRLLKLLQPHRW